MPGALLLIAQGVHGQPSDGLYRGTSDQGRPIEIMVSGGQITDYMIDQTVSCQYGSASGAVTWGTSCPIAMDGSFSCGDASCPPSGGFSNINAAISGTFGAGDTATGTFDVAVNLSGDSDCCTLDDIGWAVALDDDDGQEVPTPTLDIIVPAAGRGGGVGGSTWVTTLYISNTSSSVATVTLYWLERGQRNTESLSSQRTIQPGATLVLDDVMLSDFGLTRGGGAIGITSDQPISAGSAILNTAGGAEYGQGFPAVDVDAALPVGESAAVVGVKNDGTYRSNLYLIDATGQGSSATVTVRNPGGTMIGSESYTLSEYMPILDSVDVLSKADFANGTLEIMVTAGAVIGGASRVNQATGDPLTLAMPPVAAGAEPLAPGGTYFGLAATPSDDFNGIVVDLNDQQEVTFFELTYRPGCYYYFALVEDLSADPVPLSVFRTGYDGSANFGEGNGVIDYTIVLDWIDQGLGLFGTFEGEGSGWPSPATDCNAVFDTDDLSLGRTSGSVLKRRRSSFQVSTPDRIREGASGVMAGAGNRLTPARR
jgi:hypothetical protein